MEAAQDPIIDAEQFALMLRCTAEQVEEAAREGRLPGFKEGRGWLFVRADALAFLAERARREAAERQAQRRATDSGVLVGSIGPDTKAQRRRPPPALPSTS